MSALTTHVLDTARGVPASGVPLRLEISDGEGWREVGSGVTDGDGRCAGLMEGPLKRTVYRMTFETDVYWGQHGEVGFYPYAQIVFRVLDPEDHHHVPLLLSPFGYSTYRGS